ncbi:MAG TPA: hypothetical protein VMT89_14320, partial [Candidatus Acidoferrales bacterium]|nr:hypothetical protein [Candidatus Acidoferrales bacterium]
MAISENSAQCRDVNPDARFFDERIRPNSRDQLFLADKIAGALDQSDEDEKRAAAQTNGLPVLEKQALRREEAEWPERKTRGRGRVRMVGHGDLGLANSLTAPQPPIGANAEIITRFSDGRTSIR